MVIRTGKPREYYRVQLSLKASTPMLIMQQGTKLEELRGLFEEALSEIAQRNDNPTQVSNERTEAAYH